MNREIEPPEASATGSALEPRQTRDNLILIAVFVIANRFGGLRLAIAGASLWGIWSMFDRRRRGSPIGRFLPLLLLYLVVRGTLGIIFDSEDVYFGIGIATKALFGVGFIISVLLGKPVMSRLVPLVFPFDRPTREHPIYHATMARITAMTGVYLIVSSVWDVWLLNNSSVTGFVLIRFVVGFGLGVVAFVGTFFYAQRHLDRIPGFEGLFTMLERMSTDLGRGMTS